LATPLAGFGGLQESLGRSTLSGVEREVVGLTVSRENTSRYSMAAHSAFATKSGAAGYTGEQVFEVIAQIGYTSIANWVANVCDTPLDGPFQALAWS
jgi:alkylhydroperoxidase family enzyme